MSSWAVYTIYAADDECMYVGCSSDPWIRLGRHARRSDLTKPIARVDVAYYGSEREALDAEVVAIKSKTPTLNVRSLVSNTGKRATYGSRQAEVLAVVAAATGPVTSADINKAMNYDNAAAIVMQLVAKRQLRVVGTTASGYRIGRPAQLVVLAEAAA